MKRNHRVFSDFDALRFVDGRMDAERRAAYEAHLATDPEAAARVHLWSRQNEVLRAAFAPTPQERLPVWLRLSQLEVGSPETGSVQHLTQSRTAKIQPAPVRERPRPSGSMKALGTALLLVAIGALSIVATHAVITMPRGSASDQRPFSVPAEGPASRAWDAYRTFAVDQTHPVEVAAQDQPSLERWLMRRLLLPIRAPDLGDMGWILLGGRLTPGDAGPAAFLVYQEANNPRSRLGLYITSMAGVRDRLAMVEQMGGGTTLSWVSDSVGYGLATEKDARWMAQNAASLRSRVHAAEAN